MHLYLHLNDEEVAALDEFRRGHPRDYNHAQAARLLIRDALIGLGILPLPDNNRSRGARRR